MKPTKLLALEMKALKTIRRFEMLRPGERVVVAVSGGADSVALLSCLHRLSGRLQISLIAAHLNHCLRGREADADERFVRKLCAQLGVELLVESAQVRERATKARQNLEEAAREERYGFLRRCARKANARRIAVGHTLDDQAETVLLRFLRGSGAEGLGAIHPVVEGLVIRPFVEIQRDEILRYLNTLKTRHREDSSNRDLRFRRNLLRHEWIPALRREFNPRLLETLAREAELARETADFLEFAAKHAGGSIRITVDGGVALPVGELAAMHSLLRKLVLRQVLREVRGTLRSISARHIEALDRLCISGSSGKSVELPGGCVAVRRFKRIAMLRKRPKEGPQFEYRLGLPGRCRIPEAGMEIIAERIDAPALSAPRSDHRQKGGTGSPTCVVDGHCLPHVLIVRSRRQGDRYGGTGHRKVKKMLIDARIDLDSRSRLPVVAVSDAVVWIPGFPPARRFAASAASSLRFALEVRTL